MQGAVFFASVGAERGRRKKFRAGARSKILGAGLQSPRNCIDANVLQTNPAKTMMHLK